MVDDVPLLVPLLARIALAAVFILAAIQKLRDRAGFVRALANYTPIPIGVRRVVSGGLPGAELVLGIWLASGIFSDAAAGVGAGTLLVFAAVALWSFGDRSADCGCLGSLLKGSSGRQIALRNAGLALLALPAILVADGAVTVGNLVAGLTGAGALAWFGLAVLARDTSTSQQPRHQHDHRPGAGELDRRSFLGRAALLSSAVAGLGLGLGRLGKAEAACAACQSCSALYVFLGCGSSCCGVFMTRKMQYCNGACLSCSTWSQIQFCGLLECC